ncbi:uncharacterized protein [Nicotiana tomentosiformis]|uniref:uncharacterized protein isoform X1 n=1 Tax=Nicotiana tomentosiformis TaxID=4098 RepID=UPI0014468D8B|nr:uncharacterized protein LOC117281250 isoform X2 [Nicotiana tomentosiformis]
MEFTLSGNALKTFGRSITCLARIGNELVIQTSPPQVQCCVLLKAICSVLRTPIASIDHLSVSLSNPDASKVQWTLNCHNEPGIGDIGLGQSWLVDRDDSRW